MNDTLVNGTDSSIPFEVPALQIAIFSIKLILGLPINSYVLWLILSGAGGTIASEFFYLNITVSVIIFSLASVFYFVSLFTYVLVFLSCLYFSDAFYSSSVPLFQCCICVERYIAVVHPVVFLRYKALRYRVACCCVVWLTALAFSSTSLLSLIVCDYIFLGFSVVCISVVSFCCLSVLRALRQPGPGEGQRDGGEGNNVKRRAFKIILISLVVMLVTTISLIAFAVSDSLLTYSIPAALEITYTIATMSLFFHPLLYMHKAGKLPYFKAL